MFRFKKKPNNNFLEFKYHDLEQNWMFRALQAGAGGCWRGCSRAGWCISADHRFTQILPEKSLTLATFYWRINNRPLFFMEEIIRGSKRLVFPLLSLLEGLTFMPLLIGIQEKSVCSLPRHIHHHCFFSFRYNFTVTTCAKRKSSNDSFKRPFNACVKQPETQNTGGCMSNAAALALGQGHVPGGAAAQGVESAPRILHSAILGGYRMVFLKATYSSHVLTVSTSLVPHCIEVRLPEGLWNILGVLVVHNIKEQLCVGQWDCRDALAAETEGTQRGPNIQNMNKYFPVLLPLRYRATEVQNTSLKAQIN